MRWAAPILYRPLQTYLPTGQNLCAEDLATLGLTLAESKRLLANVQREIVAAQARLHAARRPECRGCGAACRVKNHRHHAIATPFGQVAVRLPRFRASRCRRGEALEMVSRALGVTAGTLSGWRDAFLAAGEARLSTRPADGEGFESERLKARLGEMRPEREPLEAKIAALEARGPGPLVRRRPRP